MDGSLLARAMAMMVKAAATEEGRAMPPGQKAAALWLWGLQTPGMHDVLAVAMAFDRSFCRIKEMHIDVETKGEHLRGATIPTKGDPNVSVCLSVDAPRFMEFFVDTLTSV